MPSRRVPVEGLPHRGVGDAVDGRAVGGGGERGRDHLRRKGGQLGGEGLGQVGESGHHLHGAGDGIEHHNAGGGDDQRLAVGGEGHAQRRIAGGERLARVAVQVDERDEVLASAWCREIAVVGNQEVLLIEGDSQRARLGRHVHGAVDRVIRGRHDIDAVGGEVGDIQQTARLVEGNVGSLAGDRNNRPEGGRPRGHGSGRESRRKRNRDETAVPMHIRVSACMI